MRLRPHVVALLLVLVAGMWPHLYVAFLRPESRDAVVWITRSAVTTPGWARWVFLDNHFVAYRPVTALSYTLDSVVGGFAAFPYRATDLLVHLGCAFACYVLARRLAPRLSPYAAVAAAALFLAHPVSALVVPHLARRAHSLATLFSLLGLVVLARGSGVRRALAAAGLLALGALSNEAAYAAFPVAALLLFLRGDRSAAVRALVPLVAVGGVLVAIRYAVLGSAGGYAVDAGSGLAPIVASVVTGVLGADVLRSAVTPLPVPLVAGLLVLVGTGLVVPTFLRPGTPTEEARASALAWAWIVGLVLLFAPQGVYFPRQLYVLAAPYALAVGLAFGTAATLRGAPRLVLGGAASLAAVLLAWQSPVLRGPDPVQKPCWVRHDQLVHDLELAVAALPPGTVVLPVVPVYDRPEIEGLRARDEDQGRSAGRQVFTWVTAVTGTRFVAPVTVAHDAASEEPVVSVTVTPEGPVVRIPRGAEVSGEGRDVTFEVLPDGARVYRPEAARRGSVLYVHDGSGGSIVPLPDPT